MYTYQVIGLVYEVFDTSWLEHCSCLLVSSCRSDTGIMHGEPAYAYMDRSAKYRNVREHTVCGSCVLPMKAVDNMTLSGTMGWIGGMGRHYLANRSSSC